MCLLRTRSGGWSLEKQAVVAAMLVVVVVVVAVSPTEIRQDRCTLTPTGKVAIIPLYTYIIERAFQARQRPTLFRDSTASPFGQLPRVIIFLLLRPQNTSIGAAKVQIISSFQSFCSLCEKLTSITYVCQLSLWSVKLCLHSTKSLNQEVIISRPFRGTFFLQIL